MGKFNCLLIPTRQLELGLYFLHSLKFPFNDPAANTTDRVTQFWQEYSEEADNYDKDFLLKNGNNIEGVLIFVGACTDSLSAHG